MADPELNPFEAPAAPLSDHTSSLRKHWGTVGALTGAAIPVANYLYLWIQQAIYSAQLPPNVCGCGTHVLGAFLLMIVGSPTLAVLGGVTGALLKNILTPE